MVSSFPSPILSVAADVVRDLDGEDALFGLWALFTKCKESLKDGRRLENISWRLWYREMASAQSTPSTSPGSLSPSFSEKRSPSPITPVSEDGLVAQQAQLPHPSLSPAGDIAAAHSWHAQNSAETVMTAGRRLSTASAPAERLKAHPHHAVGKIILDILPGKVDVQNEKGTSIAFSPRTPAPRIAQPRPVLPSTLPTVQLPATPPAPQNGSFPRVVVVNPTPHPTPPATPNLPHAPPLPTQASSHLLPPPPLRALALPAQAGTPAAPPAAGSNGTKAPSRPNAGAPLARVQPSLVQASSQAQPPSSTAASTGGKKTYEQDTLKASDRRFFLQDAGSPDSPLPSPSRSDHPADGDGDGGGGGDAPSERGRDESREREHSVDGRSVSSGTSSHMHSELAGPTSRVVATTTSGTGTGAGTARRSAKSARGVKAKAAHAPTRPAMQRLHSIGLRTTSTKKSTHGGGGGGGGAELKRSATFNVGSTSSNGSRAGGGGAGPSELVKMAMTSAAAAEGEKGKERGKVEKEKVRTKEEERKMKEERRKSEPARARVTSPPPTKTALAPAANAKQPGANAAAAATTTAAVVAAAATTLAAPNGATTNGAGPPQQRRGIVISTSSEFDTTDDDSDSEWEEDDSVEDAAPAPRKAVQAQTQAPAQPKPKGRSQSAAAVEAARVRTAAAAAEAEAARERDMFAKVPRRSYSNLGRTRSGLLSQLLNPDPNIFPPEHPYRVTRSTQDVPGQFRRPGVGPGVSLLTVGRSAAALPLAAQVNAQAPSTPVAEAFAPPQQPEAGPSRRPDGRHHQQQQQQQEAYRPRGRPQDEEMEDSDSDEENPDDTIQVSRSLAQQRLAALADPNRRRRPDQQQPRQPQPQPQPQQHAQPRAPPLVSGLQRQNQQQAHRSMQQLQHVAQGGRSPAPPVLQSVATAPIPLSHPYNLPAPAPPSTPRTTRRQMLQTELSESLRRNLLWERQVGRVNMAGRRAGVLGAGAGLRPLTTMDGAAAQQQQPQQQGGSGGARQRVEAGADRAVARNRSWAADDYHVAGW